MYPALLPLMAHISAASSRTELTPPADLNGLVRLAESRNVVFARVPSHFKRSLLSGTVTTGLYIVARRWEDPSFVWVHVEGVWKVTR